MNSALPRRDFLKQTSVLAAGLATLGNAPAFGAAASPSEKVRVGIIGCNGRGMAHVAGYLALPNAEIVCICDVDSRAVEKGIAAVAKKQERKPKGLDRNAGSLACARHHPGLRGRQACLCGEARQP